MCGGLELAEVIYLRYFKDISKIFDFSVVEPYRIGGNWDLR